MPDPPKVPMPVLDTSSDVAAVTRDYLENLNLLPSEEDLKRAGDAAAFFGGPPQSVAVIEAGVTAAAKWVAAGGAVGLTAMWGLVKTFWSTNPDLHAVVVWVAGLISVAVILGIAVLLASDLIGRAAGAAATVRARAEVGTAILRIAQDVQPLPSSPSANGEPLVPLSPLPVKNLASYDSEGWTAIAMHDNPTAQRCRYLVIKGRQMIWLDGEQVEFEDMAFPEDVRRILFVGPGPERS